MAKLILPSTFDFAGWRNVLGNKDGRVIGNNTRVMFADADSYDPVAIRLHSTNVVTFYRDGRIVLDSGGWQTVTTKDRMNSVLPQRFRVFAKDHVWFVSDNRTGSTIPFSDGMTLVND